MNNRWNENDHPRDSDGKFTDKVGGSITSGKPDFKESPQTKGYDYGVGADQHKIISNKTSKESLNYISRTDEQKKQLLNSICAIGKDGKMVTYSDSKIAQFLADVQKEADNPTININTPEREAMRNKMVDDYVKIYGANAKCEKKLYVVTGLAASGKSSAIANVLVKHKSAALVDADIFKEGDKSAGFQGIPEYTINGRVGLGVSKVHDESSLLAKRTQNKMIEKGMNVVYPTVGGKLDGMNRKLQDFINAGYEIHIAQAYVPLEKGLQNNLQRYVDTGRLVRPDLLLGNDGKPLEVYDELKKNPYIKSMALFRTDHNWKAGQKPKLIDKRGNEFDVIYK